MALQQPPKVDRQTTTPFYLKLFYRTGSFNRLDDFPPISPSPHPPPHLQIYTWPTCTLRELSHLLVSALPSLLPSPAVGTRLCYRLVYPDTRAPPSAPARYIAKDLGSVIVGAAEAEGAEAGGGAGQLPSEEEKDVLGRDGPGGVMKGELGGEPEKTLADARFVVGDFVDVCVVETGPDGGVGRAVRGGGVGGGGVSGRGGAAGGEYYSRGRENGFRGRGGGRGVFGGGYGGSREGVPSGEWRRGERVPGPEGGRGYGYGRGRGRVY